MVVTEYPVESTIGAIYQHYEDTREDWRRPHLGASQIGKPCPRALWYQFRWCLAPSFPGRVLRLFDTGNLEEERIVRDLRNVGVEVYDRDPDDPDKQIRYSDPNCGGHFSGSLDGVGIGIKAAPKTWHVLEFKTSNTRIFREMETSGVLSVKPEHYAQIQCYLNWSGLRNAYYVMVCKETDEMYDERIDYDPETAKLLSERAHEIIFASAPPEKMHPCSDGPECRYCDYKSLCKGECFPEINCRTCVYLKPLIMDGKSRWGCDKRDMLITENGQKDEHCPYHIFIPALMPIDVVNSAPDEDGVITYVDGTRNGRGNLSIRKWKELYS